MKQHTFRAALAVAALIALSACGGGGGGDDTPVAGEETSVPDSAVASPESFTAWVGAREATESREPVAMNAGMPPTSETAEPTDFD